MLFGGGKNVKMHGGGVLKIGIFENIKKTVEEINYNLNIFFLG